MTGGTLDWLDGLPEIAEQQPVLDEDLRAPVPYFGGKREAAALIWDRLGDVVNYIEPFAGSLAVLLARPAWHRPRVETANDIDALIVNFWRATAADPEGVARLVNWPVFEVDLHARHRSLIARRATLAEELEADPLAYDVEAAAWWAWGASCWIGGGWCADSQVQNRKRPALGGDGGPRPGNGVHSGAMREPSRQLPDLGGSSRGEDRWPNTGKGVNAAKMRRQLPALGGGWGSESGERAGAGVHGAGLRTALYDTFARLRARLRYVRFPCGDWSRVVTPAVTWRHGLTGVVLDPPYDPPGQRTKGLYAHDAVDVAEVRAWALDAGARPDMRIALCGYEGEHDELEAAGWSVVAWKARGGYGNQADGQGRANAARERIWFSPHCLSSPEQQALLLDLDGCVNA